MNIYIPQLIFFVYAYLREDGTPYYIGKGKDKRHLSKNHNINLPKNKANIVILESNLTEVGAFALERRMIQWYGRKDIKTGILRNKTSGGEGTYGFKRSEKLKKINSSITKKLWQTNEYAEKTKNKLKEYWTDENKQKHSIFLSNYWKDPENIKKGSENSLKYWSDPTNTKKCSDKTKEMWNNKDVREKIINANSFEWLLTDVKGNEIKIKNLRKFCRDNNLQYSNVGKVMRGERKQHKGWISFKRLDKI